MRFALPLALLALLASPVRAQSPIGPIGLPTKSTPPTKPTLLTPNLVITGPGPADTRYPGMRTTVPLTIKNVKAGTTVSVTPVLVAGLNCSFLAPTPVKPTTAVATSANEVQIAVPGMFPYPNDGTNGPCSFKANITATKLDGTSVTTTSTFDTIQLTPPTVYVVANTSDWLEELAFSNTAASGDCTGASNGPNGIFKVGLVTSESGQANADITFKIRSGPAGTHCKWKSQPIALPEGVRVKMIEIEHQTSSRCTLLPGSLGVIPGGFVSTANPVVTTNQEVVGANPLGAGYAVHGVSSLIMNLDCDKTLVNDHYATLIIKSLTFTGPPNLPGFP